MAIRRQSQRAARPLQWWEPPTSAWPRMVEELRETGLLRPVVWLRMVALAAAVALIVALWMRAAYPEVVIPWRALLARLVWVPALLMLCIAAVALLPRHVRLERECLFVSGQRIDAERIQSITLEDDDGHPSLLAVQYRDRRGRARSLALGVARRVDRAALERTLASIDGAGTG